MEIKKRYNIQADLTRLVPPPRNPVMYEPVTPEELAPLFLRELILKEVSKTQYIPIPDDTTVDRMLQQEHLVICGYNLAVRKRVVS